MQTNAQQAWRNDLRPPSRAELAYARYLGQYVMDTLGDFYAFLALASTTDEQLCQQAETEAWYYLTLAPLPSLCAIAPPAFISAPIVVALHHLMEQRSRTLAGGVRSEHLLHSALARQVWYYKASPAAFDPQANARVLLAALIENHPFVDGNKRTAHLSFLVYTIWHGATRGLPTLGTQFRGVMRLAGGNCGIRTV